MNTPTREQIENAARAIYEATPRELPWDRSLESTKRYYRTYAQIAYPYLQPAQEYPHHVLCSGDRKFPAGVPGHSCSCFELKPAPANGPCSVCGDTDGKYCPVYNPGNPEPVSVAMVERMCVAFNGVPGNDMTKCMTSAAYVCQAYSNAQWEDSTVTELICGRNMASIAPYIARIVARQIFKRVSKPEPTMQERVAALLGGDTKKAAEIDALYREGK
jgi:hypothetical protein